MEHDDATHPPPPPTLSPVLGWMLRLPESGMAEHIDAETLWLAYTEARAPR